MNPLLYNGHYATGLSEDEAQSTVEPVRTDGSEAELVSAPEWNAVEADDSGQLIGLSPRVVGSHTTGKEKSAPVAVTLGTYDGPRYGNDSIDSQVASSGTAAAREAAGQRGPGTILKEEGIEPLNPAQVYGNDYFLRDSLSANEGSGSYMTPQEGDNWAQQVAQSQAQNASRKAYLSTQYDAFFGSA